MAPGAAWQLTVGEIVVVLEAAEERQRTWANQLLSTAWFTEAFARTRHLPPLRSVINNKIEPPTEEDIDEGRTVFAELQEALDDGT